MRQALRSRHYSRRTERTYCQRVKRFVYFHNLCHPSKMAEREINAFLTHLAINKKVSASTQNQALSALLFLYRHVLNREVGELARARRPKRLPVVMTRDEVKAVIMCMSRSYKKLFMKPWRKLSLAKGLPVIHFDIRLRHICWKMVTTSGRFRSYLGTKI